MGTVSKALSLLGYFDQTRTAVGLSDFARLSGLNKATAYRMLSELQEQGFVEQTGAGRAYRLGPEVLRLAALRELSVPMLTVAREVLHRLSEATGETAHASVIRGRQLNQLAHSYSARHATRVMMDDAEVLPFHATASGLAVLAFSPADWSEAALGGALARFTPQTVTDPVRLRSLLRGVRASGISESVSGLEADVHAHAAPVFGAGEVPVGAIAVAAPVSRMTPAQKRIIESELRQAARDLTLRTGGFWPADYPASTPEKELTQ
ncbi:MAG: IclR family transcriptional regulator [Pseudooceanicola sp.]|nr:IclR family transcriptional regulator [Pseudooceanicola sp.]